MFKNKLKKLINPQDDNNDGNNKKKIENMVFFVIIFIITIVIINYIWNGKSNTGKTVTNTTGKQLASSLKTTSEQNPDTSTENNASDLEEKLETILAKIQGVGNVKVFINYSESSETVAMYNENSKSSTTEETDVSGGVRKVQETDSQKDIIYQENEGVKTPMTKKVVEPKIEGAIITAKGANNIDVKTKIIQAVEAVTGLATHKIQVFEMQ